jgi:hypothetical protein
MRRLAPVPLIAAALLWAVPFGPAAADPAAIRGAIDGQIEAFRADDFATAFDYASPNIRRMFRDPGNFGRMVRGGYPMVWRPERLDYLAPRETAPGRWDQDVLIEDGAGTLHALRYHMIETSEGWRINGVTFLRDAQPTA